MLQKSVFISPYDIVKDFLEFIESQGLTESVYLIQAQDVFAGDVKKLANKIWKLDKLNEEYIKIKEKIEGNDLIKESDRNKQLNDQKIGKEIRQRYLELVASDPLLPKELLPDDWMGGKVKELIRKLP